MSNILKLELKRAFVNRLFVISISIGCLIAILQVYFGAFKVAGDLEVPYGLYSRSIFNQWMGLNPNFFTILFFMIFPLLAAIPYADSLLIDYKSGYIKNVLTRVERRSYFLSKFIAVFVSAGAAVITPLLVNLYLVALCVPAVIPDVSTAMFVLSPTNPGARLFYSHPFVFLFTWILIIFIVSGALTSVALAFSYFIKYRYIVTITPFLLTMFIALLAMIVGNDILDIRYWIIPYQPAIDVPAIILQVVCILGFSISLYIIKSRKNEIL